MARKAVKKAGARKMGRRAVTARTPRTTTGRFKSTGRGKKSR